MRRFKRYRELSAAPWFPPPAPVGIFSHVPKTGGTTIHQWLKSNLRMWIYRSSTRLPAKPPPAENYVLYLGHLPLRNVVQDHLFSRKLVESLPSFAFVRNPVTRTLSLYHQQLTSQEEKISGDLNHFADQLWKNRGNFKWWTPSMRLMARPATYWVKPKSGPHIRTVYRIEEFDLAVEDLRATYKIDSYPETKNSSRVNVEDQEESTARLNEVVSELYYDDFVNFGYPFPK